MRRRTMIAILKIMMSCDGGGGLTVFGVCHDWCEVLVVV